MTARRRLPARRPSVTVDLEHSGVAYIATVGFDLTGRPREVFARAAKPDSHADLAADDVAVLLSIALQHDIPPNALAHSLGRVHGGPASIAGVLVDLIVAQAGGA